MAIVPVSMEKEFEKNGKLLRKEDLESLRDWLNKQAYLPNIPDLELICFLHSCHFSVEMAKKTIDCYYTIRTHVPEYFSNRDPSHQSVKHSMDVLIMIPLPELTEDGSRSLFMKFYNTDASHFVFAECIKLFMHVKDLMLLEYGTMDGFNIVVDMEGVTLGHLSRLSLLAFKKLFTYLQDGIPLRLKGLHYIHPVSFMDKILAMMTPFMNAEFQSKLHVHSTGMETFYQHIPKKTLPKDLGGDYLSLKEAREKTMAQIIANADYFNSEEKLRVVESQRPGKPKNAGDLFGVEGSFKKLDID